MRGVIGPILAKTGLAKTGLAKTGLAGRVLASPVPHRAVLVGPVLAIPVVNRPVVNRPVVAGPVLASVLLSVAVSAALPWTAAEAEPPRSHVCAADRPVVPVPPPLVAMPGTRTPAAGAKALEPAPSVFARPAPAAEPPAMMMGCLSREYPLRKSPLPGAQTAVSLAEAPQSAGAIYPYRSQSERDRHIGLWLAAMEPEGSPRVIPANVFIAGWQNSRWSLPGNRVVHAMFPETGQSGKLCLVRADLNGRPEALAALNNWCMDSLGLWAD